MIRASKFIFSLREIGAVLERNSKKSLSNVGSRCPRQDARPVVIFCTVAAATSNVVVEKMRMCTHTYRPVIKVLSGSIYCQWDLTESTNLAKQATCVPYQTTDPICPLNACSQMGSRVVLKWMAYMEPIFCIYTTHCLTLHELALEINW